MDHRAADAAIAHQQVRAAADDSHRDAALAAVADEKREAEETVRLHPELRGTADQHGGVAAHRLVEFAVDLALRQQAAHFLDDFQVMREARAGLVHVARAERDEQVAGLQRVAHGVMRGA